MKKILSLIAVLAIFVQSMAQNSEIIDMFHTLAQKTGNVEYERQGTIDVYTESYSCSKWLWDSNHGKFDRKQAEELLSFICPTLMRQMPKAKKLYHYEVHEQGIDTVKYTMQFELESRDSNWVYWGATEGSPEYLILDYNVSTDERQYHNFANLFIRYVKDNTIEKKATETLKGNKEAVHNLLASFVQSKKSLRPKTYPVRYEFSRELSYKEVHELFGNWDDMIMPFVADSITNLIQTGTHYFVPSDSLNAIKMYKELGDCFLSFMNERKHEWYFFREDLNPIDKLDNGKNVQGHSYFMEFQTFLETGFYGIYVSVDKLGLHILEITSNKCCLYFTNWWKNISKMKDAKIEWNKDFPMNK